MHCRGAAYDGFCLLGTHTLEFIPATIPCSGAGWFAGRKAKIPNQGSNCAETGVQVVHIRGNALRTRKESQKILLRVFFLPTMLSLEELEDVTEFRKLYN